MLAAIANMQALSSIEDQKIVQQLKLIVPEYQSNNSVYSVLDWGGIKYLRTLFYKK